MSIVQHPVGLRTRSAESARPAAHGQPLLRSAYLGFGLSVAGAVATAVVVGEISRLAAVLIGVMVATAVASFGLLPRYERAGSLLPAKVVAAGTGLLFFGCGVSGQGSQPDLQVIGAAAAGYVLIQSSFALCCRRLVRPQATLLVGDAGSIASILAAGGRAVAVCSVCVTGRQRHDSEVPELAGLHVLAKPGAIAAEVREQHIDRVVVTSRDCLRPAELRRLSWQLESSCAELMVLTGLGIPTNRASFVAVDGALGVSVRPACPQPTTAAVKALLDRSLAALLLCLLAPLMLAVGVLVKLDSAGPVLFRQPRAGRDGEPFLMFKFRTMTVDAEEQLADLLDRNEGTGPLFKIRDDPRVTRVGRLLRRSSIDELPQLINVLRGEMSLIGPRPALLREVEQYDGWTRRRLHIKPGMTGLWQVGGRSDLGWDDAVRLDLDYVDNVTLVRDLSIAAKTVRAVVKGNGAA